ncbi:serine/threonine-protein kinase [Streptacidiphilus sp. P02-A3a]|uniref:serine/threonine-protein kinase n=1 Tax=Streptacidiphilus sp. P02-A3a TaxID=2704468 RepID=UPI0015F7DD63|nr:serine/threonine-protein kinase [Streptacidiphilus sp. P02-A3a]QMU73331.1 serine/threonine protein kinase [Streptacidiphilus sp. P02-A3a]
MITLGWLLRSQVGWRSRAVADERRAELRAHYAADASQRQYALRLLGRGYPRHLYATGLDLLLGTTIVGGMAWLISLAHTATGLSPVDESLRRQLLGDPPWAATWLVHAYSGQDSGQGIAVLLCCALALLWTAAWFRTRFLLHCTRMPSGTWERSALRRLLLPQLAVRFLLVLLLLPIGAMLILLLWQGCALLAARRFHRKPLVLVPLPLPGGPATTTRPPGATGQRPAAPLPRPRPTEPWPQGGTQPQRPVPTAPAATAPAATAPGLTTPADPAPVAPVAPAPVVRCAPLHPHEPRAIGPYRLLGRIGSGGMGIVYVACLDGSATQVALKTLRRDLLGDADIARRFQREGEALSRVSSAYAARVIDSGIADGVPYLAMDLLDGSPLDAHLERQGPIRSQPALRAFGLAVAAALEAVHRAGLVHRDLKPANIMLTTAGPRLLDFGIAMILDQTRLTRTGFGSPGTLPYMAPEQFRAEPAGPWTDVWAWGCCMVAAAGGRSPFHGTAMAEIANRVLYQGPDPDALAALGAVSPELLATVRLALTPDPTARPADGAALLRALAHGDERPPELAARISGDWRTLTL